MGRSPPEGRMPAYPFTLTVPPSCFCNSERDAMSAGSGHSLALRAIVTQSSSHHDGWSLCTSARRLWTRTQRTDCFRFIIAVCGVLLLWVNHTIAAPMDFIERHLRFSPDDGDGSMEAMFLTVLVMIITVVAFRLASKTAP